MTRCPICKKPSHPKFRPFCSARCADIDLARWLDGSYRLPDAEPLPQAGSGGGEEEEGAED